MCLDKCHVNTFIFQSLSNQKFYRLGQDKHKSCNIRLAVNNDVAKWWSPFLRDLKTNGKKNQWKITIKIEIGLSTALLATTKVKWQKDKVAFKNFFMNLFILLLYTNYQVMQPKIRVFYYNPTTAYIKDKALEESIFIAQSKSMVKD